MTMGDDPNYRKHETVSRTEIVEVEHPTGDLAGWAEIPQPEDPEPEKYPPLRLLPD